MAHPVRHRRAGVRRSALVAALAVASLAGVASFSRVAHAEDRCPLGSVEKSESGSTWCEPTVCDADNQCATGSVCRQVALCVEVGTIDAGKGGDAAANARLLVRQRCGENKSCPSSTTCSEKSRCMTLAQADKAGLTPPPASSGSGASSAGSPTSDAPAKKACGCSTPGTRGGELGASALALVGLAFVAVRRRSRR